MITYLTKEAYSRQINNISAGHWNTYRDRWTYHKAAIAFCRLSTPPTARDVLEIGTMGITIVNGSDTMDILNEEWNYKNFASTYIHDARSTPWPIATKKYHTLIALRVYQHLAPKQMECFSEAKRVAKNIILVVPEKYNKSIFPQSRGILEADFLLWNNGVPPTVCFSFGGWLGNFYYWNSDSLS